MKPVPHQFQSITEKQWKLGHNRHLCATCQHDYGDPVHTPVNSDIQILLSIWAQDFISDAALDIVEGLRGLDDESLSVTIELHALDAVEQVTRDRN